MKLQNSNRVKFVKVYILFSVAQDLLAFLAQRRGQCGIVYARLRATCDWLAREIGNAEAAEAAAYHAGKDSEQRSRVRGSGACPRAPHPSDLHRLGGDQEAAQAGAWAPHPCPPFPSLPCRQVQQGWSEGAYDCVVATVAFGEAAAGLPPPPRLPARAAAAATSRCRTHAVAAPGQMQGQLPCAW